MRIAITTDGLTTAYYVDPTKLILLPDFFNQPTSGALITIDSENLPLDGRKGSWMTIDTLRIDGRNLFLMQSETYGKRSILERLQEKQGQVGSISTPARFQDSQSIEDAERIRK